MKLTKSYTCKISGTRAKLDVLESMFSELDKLSKFIFANKEIQKDFNKLYKICRLQFPSLHSKILQNFLRFGYWKKGKSPKSPVKSSIYLDYQTFNLQINSNKLTNFWLKFAKRKFPLFGKYLISKIVDPEKVKLIQLFKRKGNLYCKLTYVQDLSDSVRSEGPTVGLDMNFRTVVLSDNSFFSMSQLAHRKLEHKKNKRKLGNYTKDFTHKLTTEIANYLQSIGASRLILEDLKNLCKSVCKKQGKSKGKLVNYIINSMPYGMVAQQLVYKCLDRGVEVSFTNPAYTSKMCSRCNSLNTARPTQNTFVCNSCKLALHADLNAARNIEKRAISQLNGPPETTAQPAA